MNAPNSIDPTTYVVAPRLSVPAAVSLGISLLTVVPKPAPAVVKRAADRLRDAVLQLQQVWRQQLAVEPVATVSPKDADLRVDRAFRALSMRIEALSLLPDDLDDDVALARATHERLFPDGLRFLTLPHAQQWAHCDRILATIDDDEALAADLPRLAGELVLAELRAAQEQYGEALGITVGKPTVDQTSLVAPLDAVRSAIVGYGLQVVAMQADDPTRVAAARQALRPIDQLRAAQSRRPGSGAATEEVDTEDDAGFDVTPDTPVPDLGG